MQSFFDLKPQALQSFCRERDLPRYVADQLLDWVYDKGVVDPEAMTNLSKAARGLVADSMRFLTGEVAAHQVAGDGTQKLLIAWAGKEEAAREGGLVPISERALDLAGRGETTADEIRRVLGEA